MFNQVKVDSVSNIRSMFSQLATPLRHSLTITSSNVWGLCLVDHTDIVIIECLFHPCPISKDNICDLITRTSGEGLKENVAYVAKSHWKHKCLSRLTFLILHNKKKNPTVKCLLLSLKQRGPQLLLRQPGASFSCCSTLVVGSALIAKRLCWPC